MTAPTPGLLGEAASDLHTAQYETDPSRQAQYARAAADAADEVVMDRRTSTEDRERAAGIARSARRLITGSLLREAQSLLVSARDESDLQRRRELARSAVANARQATTNRDATDLERAQARQMIGAGRALLNITAENRSHQQITEREPESPGIAL